MLKCAECGKDISEGVVSGDKTFCNDSCKYSWQKISAGVSREKSSIDKSIHKNRKTVHTTVTAVVALIVACLTSAIISNLMRSDFTKFEQFNSSEGSFSVFLPKKVIPSKETINTAAGPITACSFSAKAKHHQFMVAFSDYPENAIKSSTPELMLNGARNGSVRNIQGTLLSETFVTINGYPGRDLRIEGPQKTIIVTRLILANQRLYQVMILCRPDHSFDKIIDKVIQSFSITKLNT